MSESGASSRDMAQDVSNTLETSETTVPEPRKKKEYKGWVSLSKPEIAQIYLATLEETGNYAQSARAAGCSRDGAVCHRKNNPEFQALCDEALARYGGAVHAELRRRAIDGVEQDVYWQGQVVGTVTKYSDRLLELEAKRVMPEYREASGGSRTTVNVSATATATAAAAQATGPMAALAGIDPSKLPKASRELYRALLASLPQQPGLPSPDASALPQGEGQDLSLPMLDVASHELHEATESPPVAGNAAGDPMPRGIFQARGEDSSDSDE